MANPLFMLVLIVGTVFDSGVDICATSISKAFDSVPHQPLLKKLKDLNVHAHILKWLTHYILSYGLKMTNVSVITMKYLFL